MVVSSVKAIAGLMIDGVSGGGLAGREGGGVD